MNKTIVTQEQLEQQARNSIWLEAGGSGRITASVEQKISQLPKYQQKSVLEKLVDFFSKNPGEE